MEEKGKEGREGREGEGRGGKEGRKEGKEIEVKGMRRVQGEEDRYRWLEGKNDRREIEI